MKRNGNHYVIGDVHGCYDELMALLHKIEEKDSNAQILFVGDFIDEGPKVLNVLEWAMEHITEDGKYQSVRGKHEQMILYWYQRFLKWREIPKKRHRNHNDYDGPKLHYDYLKWKEKLNLVTLEKLEPIINFFESLPYEKKITILGKENTPIIFRIVHGWSVFDNAERDYSFQTNVCGNYKNDDIVVHGHIPTLDSHYINAGSTYPGLIGYRRNAINVDCGCYYAYRNSDFPCMLGAICLETLEEIYPMSLEERLIQINPDIYKENVEEYIEKYKMRCKELCGRHRDLGRKQIKRRLMEG